MQLVMQLPKVDNDLAICRIEVLGGRISELFTSLF